MDLLRSTTSSCCRPLRCPTPGWAQVIGVAWCLVMPVMTPMSPVVVERLPQAFLQFGPRLPADDRPNLANVRVEITRLLGRPLRGERGEVPGAAGAQSLERSGQVQERRWPVPADVEDLAHGLVAPGRGQNRVHTVIDIDEVAEDAAGAEDADRLAVEGLPHEPVDHPVM